MESSVLPLEEPFAELLNAWACVRLDRTHVGKLCPTVSDVFLRPSRWHRIWQDGHRAAFGGTRPSRRHSNFEVELLAARHFSITYVGVTQNAGLKSL